MDSKLSKEELKYIVGGLSVQCGIFEEKNANMKKDCICYYDNTPSVVNSNQADHCKCSCEDKTPPTSKPSSFSDFNEFVL